VQGWTGLRSRTRHGIEALWHRMQLSTQIRYFFNGRVPSAFAQPRDLHFRLHFRKLYTTEVKSTLHSLVSPPHRTQCYIDYRVCHVFYS